MKVGIIVHSKTGNTLHVAEKIMNKVIADGYSASIEQVTATNDGETDINKIQLTNMPNISEYDVVILGAPVRGFSLSPIMQSFLSKCKSLHGKNVGCYVTQQFPYPWMGGNRAIEQMKGLCKSIDANVTDTAIINMSNKKREKMITNAVEKLSCIKPAASAL